MEEKEITGVKVRTICFWLLISAIILFILLLFGLFHITVSYRSLVDSTNTYIEAETNIRMLESAHSYLTETSRQYAVTMEPSYMDAYFEEVYESQRREKAVEELVKLAKGKRKLRTALEGVVEGSSAMMELEIHSMRLVSVLNGLDEAQLPEDVAAYELTQEEMDASDLELRNSAYKLVFGKDYQALQQQILGNLSDVTDAVSEITEREQTSSRENLQKSLTELQIYVFLLFLLTVVIFVILTFFVLRPVNRYVRCIEEEKDMEVKGLYEFKFLAYTYNKIHNRNMTNSQELQRKAEHDALTGIWNRTTFESLKESMTKSFCPLTLLLIDVDNFKGVNDNYGHEIGDRALKRVAKMLKEQFRSNDYPIRIGGDEFAVLMVNATPRDKAVIRQKINGINEALQKGKSGIPPLSLSVGVAFSESGYNNELYLKADAALYRTKEKGKCGITFHGE